MKKGYLVALSICSLTAGIKEATAAAVDPGAGPSVFPLEQPPSPPPLPPSPLNVDVPVVNTQPPRDTGGGQLPPINPQVG